MRIKCEMCGWVGVPGEMCLRWMYEDPWFSCPDCGASDDYVVEISEENTIALYNNMTQDAFIVVHGNAHDELFTDNLGEKWFLWKVFDGDRPIRISQEDGVIIIDELLLES